jgi:hypothetical protein
MKITQYNWNWWFVLSALAFVTLIFVTGMLDEATYNAHTGIITTLWILCVINMIPCLYIGLKEESHSDVLLSGSDDIVSKETAEEFLINYEQSSQHDDLVEENNMVKEILTGESTQEDEPKVIKKQRVRKKVKTKED